MRTHLFDRRARGGALRCAPLRAALIVCTSLLSTACTLNSDRANELGASGKDFASQYTQLYAALDSAAKSMHLASLYFYSDSFVCPEANKACAEGRARILAGIESGNARVARIRASLALRTSFMKSLSDCYAAFLDLNSTQVRAEFEKSLANLTNSVSAFAALNGQKALPKFAAGVVSQTGGVVIELFKMEMLRESSARIRERLELFVAIEAKDRPALVIGYDTLEDVRYQAVKRLWQQGALRIEGAFSSVIDGYPVRPVTAETALTYRRGSPVAAAFEQQLLLAKKVRVAAFSGAQDQLAESLAELIKAHRKYEAGEAPDLGDLTRVVQEIRRFVEHFEPPKK